MAGGTGVRGADVLRRRGRAAEPGTAYQSGNEIRMIRAEGTHRVALTRTPAGYESLAPGWSVRGDALGFIRRHQLEERQVRSPKLMIVDLASGLKRTFADRVAASAPSFSPDGRWMVYAAEVRARGELTSALHVAAVDGSGGSALTEPTVGAAMDADPAWSPDGLRIAFTRLPAFGSDPEVWSIAPGGGDVRRLAASGRDPGWSPDGEQIAFVSTRDANGTTCFHDCSPNAEVYVMDATGEDQRRLTYTATDEAEPAWSPDGTQIAFSSARPVPERNQELYSMRADGSCTTRLTNTSVSNGSPAWRPAGAYSSPLVCDGILPAARRPVMETDLRPARRHRDFPLAWLGASYRGVLLSAVDVGEFVTFIYDDCGRPSAICPVPELQVQSWSICRRDPLWYGGYSGPGKSDHSPHVGRYRRVGRALVASHEFGVDVYAGPTTITVFGSPSFARALAIASRLRRLRGGLSALHPPRFHPRTLARVRTVRRELRRYGMRRLSRRWRMSPEQIAMARHLRNVLRPAELRRGTRCDDA